MKSNLLYPSGPVDLDGTKLLLSVILLHLIGPQAIMVQPAFVEGMVSQLGFTASDAGYVAAAENIGKAVQSVIMMVLITKVNWRTLYYAALSVLIIGNGICLFIDSPEHYRIIRFCTGLANGTIVPLSYVIVGLTARTERNFGFLMISLMIYGAAVFYNLPTVFSYIGLNGLIIIFGAFAVSGLPFVRNMPSQGDAPKVESGDAVTLSWGLRGSALAAMFTYFLGTFAMWVFLSLIGRDAGLEDQTVANALTMTQFAGMAGALVAIVVGDRLGRALPLGLALVGAVVAITMIANVQTAIGFTIGACLFNMLWNVTHPYLLAAQASFDRSGRQVSFATAMQMLGIAAGPTVGSAILDAGGGFEQIMVLAGVMMIVTLVLIQPPVLREAVLSKKEQVETA
jgi:predicted MFS family arabinose efflux permease